MSQEIELKYQIDEKTAKNVTALLIPFTILSQGQIFLKNSYYDSTDNYFAQHKMGFRVRCQNGEFCQTLKTKGKIENGLHIRPEYEMAIPSEIPNLELFHNFQDLNLPTNLKLEEKFSTDFQRTYWLIRFQNAEIEIALDQGEVKAYSLTSPICELEFELKTGEIQVLRDFIEQLHLPDTAKASNISKAQRGYELLKTALDMEER